MLRNESLSPRNAFVENLKNRFCKSYVDNDKVLIENKACVASGHIISFYCDVDQPSNGGMGREAQF